MKKNDHVFRKYASIGLLIGVAGVAFLLACARGSGPGVPASDIGREVICPVTGDTFKITKDTPFIDHNGKRIYFCCPGCDKIFAADPQKYLKKDPVVGTDPTKTPSQQEKSVKYYTCSMHPSVRSDEPGDCPICGMELIPVYEKPTGGIVVDEKTRAALNIQSEPAIKRALVKKIHVPGKVARDEELYLAQQEYVSVQAFGGELEQSAKLKLKLLGFSDHMIHSISANGTVDKSLILPAEHRAWLFAEVYEKDLPIVEPGFGVEVTFNSYPGHTFSGVIQAIEVALDPQTRSSTARILLKHPMVKLGVGMYADVEIRVPLGEKLSVPAQAIIDTGKRQLVYVEAGKNQYVPRVVKVGNETDEYVEVLDGLSAGERVVTEGNFLLDSQTTLAGGQSLLYGGAEEVKQETKPAVHQH